MRTGCSHLTAHWAVAVTAPHHIAEALFVGGEAPATEYPIDIFDGLAIEHGHYY